MTTAPATHASVKISGVIVQGMKLMPSRFTGFCRYHQQTFPAGQQIAYKHRDGLTPAQKEAIFGAGQVTDLTVMWPLQGPEVIRAVPVAPVKTKKWDWTLSEYQENIWTKLTTTFKHIFVEALAGCAKTSSLIRFAKDLGRLGLTRGKNCWYLAFNASIRKEVYPDLAGTGVRASTTHSFLLNMVLKKRFPDLNIDNCINDNLTDDNFLRLACGDNGLPFTSDSKQEIHRLPVGRMHQGVVELVGLLKSWAVLPMVEGDRWAFAPEQRQRVLDLIEEYRIVVENPWTPEDYADMALRVLAAGIPMPGQALTEIDFNDMLYLPLALQLPFPKVDLVMTDESQDFNACQIMALHLLIQKGARVVVVGDEFQACYRFRGADCRAFQNILEMLKATQRGVEVCELPLNYRCDQAIIEHARQWVPKITGNSTERGVVKDVYLGATVQEAIKLDGKSWAFVGRTNAPLVTVAFYTMQEMIKTVPAADRKQVAILGRNAALGPLRSMIYDLCGRYPKCGIADKMDGERVVEKGFLTRLADYRAGQVARLGNNPKYALRLEEIVNNCQCLEIVAVATTDDKVTTILEQLDSLFVEDVSDPDRTIVISTAHRAKGLEWDEVMIPRPDLMPHPLAMPNEDGSWSDEQQQEENLCYIAATRARHSLGYIRDWPFDQAGKKLDLVSVNNNPAAVGPRPAIDPFASMPDQGMVWTPPAVRSTGPARRAIDVHGVPEMSNDALAGERGVLELERHISEDEGFAEQRFVEERERRKFQRVEELVRQAPPVVMQPPMQYGVGKTVTPPPVAVPPPPLPAGEFVPYVDDGEPF